MATDSDSKVLLFADDTGIIITGPNQDGLQTALNKTLSDTNSWFNPLNTQLNPICHFLALLDHHIVHVSRIRVTANFLLLNLNKTYYLQF